jgi:hypothetical protein
MDPIFDRNGLEIRTGDLLRGLFPAPDGLVEHRYMLVVNPWRAVDIVQIPLDMTGTVDLHAIATKSSIVAGRTRLYGSGRRLEHRE